MGIWDAMDVGAQALRTQGLRLDRTPKTWRTLIRRIILEKSQY